MVQFNLITQKIEEMVRQHELNIRSQLIEILYKYTIFLEKEGYTDVDWRTEEPYAIDEFLRKLENKEL